MRTDADGAMPAPVPLPGNAPGAIEATAWLRVALAHKVMFVPGEAFYDAAPDPASLRLSFATTPPGLTGEGARRLRAALDAAMAG